MFPRVTIRPDLWNREQRIVAGTKACINLVSKSKFWLSHGVVNNLRVIEETSWYNFRVSLGLLTTDIILYHINCGVIQGFSALRKAVTTHTKKHRIFSRVLIQPISC